MKKKIVVIDTNVFVSAAIGNGYSSRILTSFSIDNTFQIVYSKETLSEYYRVAAYDRISKKYPLFKVNMISMIIELESKGYNITVTEQIASLEDSSDNKFLDLAYACGADYLITGNHPGFTIVEFHNTKIVNPKIFWDLHQSGQL